MVNCKFKSHTRILKILLILTLLNIVNKIQAVSANGTHSSFENRGLLLVWLEVFIFLAFIVTLFYNIRIIRHYGRSIVGRPFIYILVGMAFLALARIYIIFYNFHIYDLEETTLQFGWHVIFYTGMISFLLSINNLDRRSDNELQGFKNVDFLIISLLILSTGFAFVLTIVQNKTFAKNFDNSIFDTSGFVHFIAFILSGYLALKLLKIRATSSDDDLGKLIVSFIPSFLIFLSLMSLNHFWELVTESWGLLNLNQNIVETVEQVFWLPGYMVTAYGLRQVHSLSQSSLIYQDTTISTKAKEENTLLMDSVLQILSHHIGSSALSIVTQSCNDIGIQFNDIDPSDIDNLSVSVHENTRELIGEFASRFLEQAIKLVATIYPSST